jgi:outer membrane protein assembly factor BamD (BamD/ComL family)
MAQRSFQFVTFCALLFLFQGCETTSSYTQGNEFTQGLNYQQDGRFEQAALLYRSYLQQNPQGGQAEAALFRLGESYYMLGDSTSALKELNAYTRQYPTGQYLPNARIYLENLRQEIERTPLPSDMKPIEDRKARVVQLEAEVKKNPQDADARISLANAYIDVQALTLAEKSLAAAEPLVEDYSQTEKLQQARKRLAEAKAKKPMYASDLYNNSGALRIVNDQGQLRQRGEVSDRQRRYFYVVTGQIENRSDQRFNSVEVQVDLYDFFEKLLASQTQRVGLVAPQGRRAFSMEISLDMPAETQVSRHQITLIY